MNDNPLEFNVGKSKTATGRVIDDKDDASQSPTEKRERRRSDRRERDKRDNDKLREDSDSNLSNPQQDVVPLQNGPASLGPGMWGGMMGKFN